jgi:hypothetical protein
MKSFRLIISLLLLSCVFATVNAQVKKAKVSTRTKGKTCQSNRLSFPCPKNLQVKSDGKTGVFVAYSPAKKFGVFAFAPDKTLSEQDLADQALKSALQNLYSTKLADYEWKDSEDFYDKNTFSKYEAGKSAKAGFNKNRQHAVHLQYVRLAYKQKDIIAGFIYEMESGSAAEKFFNDWTGGGNGEASEGLHELIVKITGEKKNTETPGGPPPMAMPKSN